MSAPTAEPDLSPRRLVLTLEEWAVLTAGRVGEPPPHFAAGAVDADVRNVAVASLVRRRVVVGGAQAEPVPAVAAQLEVLRRPLFTLRLDITGRAGDRHGWFAVGSGMVVGVLTLPGRRIELSLAPAVRLGSELARAVPEAGEVTGHWSVGEDVDHSVRLAGRLPLALLEDAPSEGATADEMALARELERRTAGSLSCLVLGRMSADLVAGQVSWLATDSGWVGLRPRPDGSARRLVELVPVVSADLGTWTAPTVGALLEEPDDAA